MSLLKYMQPKRKLPTPEEAGLSPAVTREVNKTVEKALMQPAERGSSGKKRKYTTFTAEDRAAVGRYAAEHGNAAAVKKFKATLDIGESTVRVFKKTYLQEVKKLWVAGTDLDEIKSLPACKRGRKLFLGDELDCRVQKYDKALCNAGTPLGSSIVTAAVEGIVKATDRTLLAEHGGHITLTKTWALSLLGRMGYVKRKATTKSTPGMSNKDFEEVKTKYLDQITRVVKLREIPDKMIINLDQTGLKLVPSGEWTMAVEGSKRVEMVGLGDKRQITATFVGSLDGKFLPMQILYQGKTDRSHPKYAFPDGFDIYHTPNHWANEETCIRFFEKIIFPYIKEMREVLKAPTQKALVIMDNFSGQTTSTVFEKVEEEGIVLVMVPPGTTDRLQPLDVSTNKPSKDFLRERFRHWYAEQVHKQLQAGVEDTAVKVNMGMPVMKEIGACWLTALYAKLCSESSLITNELKNVGISDAVSKAREVPISLSPAQHSDEDPFNTDEEC